jgi:CheY-like chemotaxis protein
LTLAVANHSAVVSLLDTGIGFESGFADKLFEPFVQHEQGRDRNSGGLGLGLAIAARLAKLQNGSLTASSPGIGQGALFTVTLPVSPRLNDTSVNASLVLPFASKSVHFVEDTRDVADGVAELLRLHGVSVRVAYDDISAIKSALDAVPDLILCDLGLPGGMDGLAVARACRAENTLRDVPLVATSGYSSAKHHANATIAGFDSLVIKPLTEEVLRRLIR